MGKTRDLSKEGNGNPLQCSCLENPMDGGAWWAAVHGVTKSRTRLSTVTFTFHFHALEKANGNPLQCSCLENPRDGGAWWAAVCGVTQSQTRLKWLSSSSSRQNQLHSVWTSNSFSFDYKFFENVFDIPDSKITMILTKVPTKRKHCININCLDIMNTILTHIFNTTWYSEWKNGTQSEKTSVWILILTLTILGHWTVHYYSTHISLSVK